MYVCMYSLFYGSSCFCSSEKAEAFVEPWSGLGHIPYCHQWKNGLSYILLRLLEDIRGTTFYHLELYAVMYRMLVLVRLRVANMVLLTGACPPNSTAASSQKRHVIMLTLTLQDFPFYSLLSHVCYTWRSAHHSLILEIVFV
jgi:hypothetical protein